MIESMYQETPIVRLTQFYAHKLRWKSGHVTYAVEPQNGEFDVIERDIDQDYFAAAYIGASPDHVEVQMFKSQFRFPDHIDKAFCGHSIVISEVFDFVHKLEDHCISAGKSFRVHTNEITGVPELYARLPPPDQ